MWQRCYKFVVGQTDNTIRNSSHLDVTYLAVDKTLFSVLNISKYDVAVCIILLFVMTSSLPWRFLRILCILIRAFFIISSCYLKPRLSEQAAGFLKNNGITCDVKIPVCSVSHGSRNQPAYIKVCTFLFHQPTYYKCCLLTQTVCHVTLFFSNIRGVAQTHKTFTLVAGVTTGGWFACKNNAFVMQNILRPIAFMSVGRQNMIQKLSDNQKNTCFPLHHIHIQLIRSVQG